ncbi:3-isopropylmalate dehydratase large subunit [Striga asiatica]|uniref:3-isopropylmalate dehydratase large subunit n=1 Tax=Striga asiatica TaxID=4170 RepID=A0A5A7NVS2_STRAF|nr:3-isopropylmalate dehydratase large subunit [Striga asiatica]
MDKGKRAFLDVVNFGIRFEQLRKARNILNEANFKALRENRLCGCLCLRECKSPPGQYSITTHEKRDASNSAKSVGKNGWSSRLMILRSVSALAVFFFRATASLSTTFIA